MQPPEEQPMYTGAQPPTTDQPPMDTGAPQPTEGQDMNVGAQEAVSNLTKKIPKIDPKQLLNMNPDSILFKPFALIVLIVIIILYWVFFGLIYQNEYFKNASIFWVTIITLLFLLFSK
jgi:hypothetical protein